MPAYSSPLLECLSLVMVVSFLGTSGEETTIHLFWDSRSSSSTGSIVGLRLRRSGVGDGDGDGDLWERGIFQASSMKLRAAWVWRSEGKLHGQTGRC